jgi:hypothetical protein
MDQKETQKTIISLLRSTNRDGIESLIKYLEDEGFFESPASARFHGSYSGGLAKHSLRVYEMLKDHVSTYKPNIKSGFGQMQYKFDGETLIIAGLLHDLCKIGAYVRTKDDDGWTNNRAKEKGHAALSIKRIEKYIKLTKIEKLMIKYHMGIYGTKEFQDKDDNPNGEYPLRGDHSGEKENPTREEREEYKKRRYGKSLANTYYHNPVCKIMSICDELATFEEKASEVPATS